MVTERRTHAICPEVRIQALFKSAPARDSWADPPGNVSSRLDLVATRDRPPRGLGAFPAVSDFTPLRPETVQLSSDEVCPAWMCLWGEPIGDTLRGRACLKGRVRPLCPPDCGGTCVVCCVGVATCCPLGDVPLEPLGEGRDARVFSVGPLGPPLYP